MPPDPEALRLGFADLFDHLGTDDLRYSARAGELSGRDIVIEGFLSHIHGPGAAVLLVDQPGLCPDCSPAPAAAITLQGAPMLSADGGEPQPVRVMGKLNFGFRIDHGVASFIRIERAAVTPVEAEP